MYIMAPINMDSDDYLGYWMAIRSDRIAEIWHEIIDPISDFIDERFPESARKVKEAPVKYINPETAVSYRERGLRAKLSRPEEDTQSFIDSRMMDALYVTDDKPMSLTTNENGEPNLVDISETESISSNVGVCFMASPDVKSLEADIYGFFLAHICKRLESLFYSAFPNVHYKNTGGSYIVTCPDLETAREQMTDKDISAYLDSHLTLLRMEKMTFEPLDSRGENIAKNHARIIAEGMIKKNFSFVEAIEDARKDGFEIPPSANAYPPLLAVWLRPVLGNIFCSWSVYKNNQLFEELSMEMYSDDKDSWINRYLFRWYDVLNDMNGETDSTNKWTIVMTDLIHG